MEKTVPQDTLNILMKGSDINFPELAINPEKNVFQHHKNKWMCIIKLIRSTAGVSLSETGIVRMLNST